MMQNDIQNVLSGMLADWHRYCQREGAGGDYPKVSAGFGQYRPSRQYDWSSGVESDDMDQRVMEGFHQATKRVPNEPRPWNTALQFEARNLAVRHQVWASPRLPADREAREVLILEARVRLLRELAKDGVLC